ncbi:hypothetical protein St703_15490 [Sporolactobacillus terrae]|uniref:Uncharacterized protein n=1 Tax=Sporolactobacillus terrae TaxID=269673 RepID=A0A5K7WYQ7_9BACL|nr:hypothetical protein St703_15490 [Sporolactobacillus terrae]
MRESERDKTDAVKTLIAKGSGVRLLGMKTKAAPILANTKKEQQKLLFPIERFIS